jgi:hypothetical protein
MGKTIGANIWWEGTTKRHHLEDQCVDGAMLRFVFNSVWGRDQCPHGNESSGPLSNQRVLKDSDLQHNYSRTGIVNS